MPKKPRSASPRRPKDTARFIQRARFEIPMHLRLDFDRPVPLAEMQVLARRLLDALQLDSLGVDAPPPFAEAHLRCPQLQRSLRVPTEPDSFPQQDH